MAKMSDTTGRVIWDMTEQREGLYTGSCDLGLVQIETAPDAYWLRTAHELGGVGGVLGSGLRVNGVGYNASYHYERGKYGKYNLRYVYIMRVGFPGGREPTDAARRALHLVADAALDALLAFDPHAFDKADIREAKKVLKGYREAEAEAKSNAERMEVNVGRMIRAMRIKEEVAIIKAEDAAIKAEDAERKEVS